MEENKEKEILDILASFEQELDDKLENIKSKVQKVKYYEVFKINEINFKNIFITEEKDEQGNVTHHIYCGDSSNEIMIIDEQGKVEIKNAELAQYLSETDLEKTIEENETERLTATSKKVKNIDKEEEKQVEDETQSINKDLKQQGQDLEISSYKKINDSHIAERMPEVFKNGEENGFAYSKTLGKYVIISKVDGQYKINENIEPAQMTMKSIISISADGERVEKKVPHALMKLPNNGQKEIAFTIDQYGYPNIETVDVLPCQQRIARAVRTQGEGVEAEENFETRREFEANGKQYEHDIAHQVQEIEQAQIDSNQIVDNDITPEDYIPNTEMTWGELMEDTGESLIKLIERYNREMTKNDGDSQNAVDTIEQDYGNVNRQREH